MDMTGNGIKNKTVNVGTNVALRHVRLTTVAVQMQEVLHIMSVCLHP